MRKTLLKLLMGVFFFLTTSISYSQTKSKHHFEILNTVPDSVAFYESLVNQIDLEPFRLIESDRIINFSNGVQVKIYSANYLFQTYQKRTHPLNKHENELKHLITFDIDQQNSINIIKKKLQ